MRKLNRAYAIDLTGNGRADLLFVEDNFKDDYTSTATWLRVGGRWKRIAHILPC